MRSAGGEGRRRAAGGFECRLGIDLRLLGKPGAVYTVQVSDSHLRGPPGRELAALLEEWRATCHMHHLTALLEKLTAAPPSKAQWLV